MNLIIGIILAATSVVVTILMSGDLKSFWSLSSAFIVLGGTIFSTVASFSFPQLKSAVKAIGIAFRKEDDNLREDIDVIINLANIARRDGLLALEELMDEMKDPFMKKAIMLVVDGSDPEMIESVLDTELQATKARHADNRAVFDAAAAYAPSYGMAGTIIGLICMLRNLSDMASLGPSMAVALITTFYGSILANIVFSPMSKRLKTLGALEYTRKEMVIEGVLAIENGENPRIIKEKLESFLSRMALEGKIKAPAAETGEKS
ncbi:MAG: motility protein A [Ruminococcaceae bacterium]|nr:motility protein A [Oscillospiraceae bacterium]